MKELSNRSANFTDSVIRRMTRVANKYGAVNLSQGFPDFEPPKAITDRLARVAGEGPHQYALTVKSKFVCKFIFQLCGFIYATFIFKRFD